MLSCMSEKPSGRTISLTCKFRIQDMNQAEALTKSQTASSSQSAWRAYALLRPTFCLIYFLDDGIKGGTYADPVD